ncbi:dockerin type I domain-containing protein [Stieleria varia]|uniref:Uncharacterized protein n=1 Tax=Stieleria varia TaxID=2528005 RepID=A0A5C5ZXY8_9BACT|nr:dockerin type I domain-containing protein [Stieleria varia]TWT91153.1 hypothetical protein Pla52n_66950 [Stieleria varia]
MEQLESRQLLAADFIVDEPARDLKLQVSGNEIRVIDLADGSFSRTVAVGDIDSDKVQITANSLLVDSAVGLDGDSLEVTANKIEFKTGGSLNTADLNSAPSPVSEGNSGDITLTAREIVLGASTLSSVIVGGGAFSAGDITLTATDKPPIALSVFADTIAPALYAPRDAKITLSGATLRGDDVSITAEGETSSRWDEIGGFGEDIGQELIGKLQAVPQLAISALSPISGQVKIHDASAAVSLTDVTINSDASVTIGSTASADASFNTIAMNGATTLGSVVLISLGYSQSKSSATVNLQGNTVINAGGSVDITSNASSESAVTARADANAVGSSNSVEAAFNVAAAYTTENSTIMVSQTTNITSGGSVTVDAQGKVVNEVTASTSIFDDGFGGASLAVGVDDATIKAEVHGTITSNGNATNQALSFAATDVSAANDQITLNNIPATHPLRVGERFTYDAGPGNEGAKTDIGLVDGRTYIVREASDPPAVPPGNGLISQTVRLVSADSIDLDARQVPTGSQHTLTKLAAIKFAATDVTAEAGTNDGLISLPTLPAGVTQLTYLGSKLAAGEDADTVLAPIAGLAQNQTYDVTRVGNQVKLKLPGAADFIDFVAPANGEHGFYYTQAVQTFDARTAVDHTKDTITLPAGHGLQTGDLVFYGTDPTKTIAREFASFGAGGNAAPTTRATINLPDAPIRGLEDNFGYHVIVDAHAPNQIRLATSAFAAAAASIVDLTAGTGAAHQLIRQTATSGIVVKAHMDASNSAEAGMTLSDKEDQPWPSVTAAALSGDIDKVFGAGQMLLEKFRGMDAVDQAEQRTGTESDKDPGKGFDLAGSVSIAYFEHDVHAIVGSTAILRSMGDITVNGHITQEVGMTATSEATRKGTDDSTGNDIEISVAVGVGIYDNDAQAVIQNGAQLDAFRATAITADVDYPMKADSVGAAINPLTTLQENGLSGFDSLNDGLLGLSGLFTSQTRTLAGSAEDKFVLAMSAVVTDYTNNVLASVGDNAKINQDATLNSNEQSVLVDAKLNAILIDVGQQSAINLSAPGFLESYQNNQTPDGETFDPKQVKDFFTELVNPLGVSGKNAAGGAMLLALADNTVVAQIGQGAQVHADAAGVTVNADSDFFNVSVVQTGTGSTDFGFSASISAADFESDTRASIGTGVTIDAGTLSVTAKDVLDRISIAGAFLKGEQAGIGASVGVNLIDQTVSAYIGRADTTADLAAPAATGINVPGAVTVSATSAGDIFAFVMSGAAQGFKTDADTPSAEDGAAKAKVNSNKVGAIALTVPVAYNDVTSNVQAYVDQYKLSVGTLNVSTDSAQDIQSVVIGASFALQTSSTGGGSKLDLAGAGAVAINDIQIGAAAFVKDSDVTSTGAIDVSAMDRSIIMADGGGFAITAASSSSAGAAISFGASIGINDITSNVSALLENVDVVAGGNVSVKAKTDTDIDSLTIAGAVSGRAGTSSTTGSLAIGGALSLNSVTNSVTADIVDGNVMISSGDLLVQAIDSTEINADAGGFAISAAVSGGTTLSGGIGVGLAFNDIENTTTAKIQNSPVNAAGNVTVDASADTAKIDALTVAATLAVAGGRGLSASLAAAGAGTHNEINNTVSALITGSGTVKSTGGDINVIANDTSLINSQSIGASVAASISGSQGAAIAVGVSIARNEISNQISAAITNTTVNADIGSVKVETKDSSTINALSVAASLSATGSASAGLSLSGGGSVASNVILTDANASITDSTVTATSDVKISADSMSTIDAGVYGLFLGGAASASAAGAAAIGAAIANNFIGYDIDENHQSSDALATLTNSSITSNRLNINSQAGQTINSVVLVGSAAIAAGGGPGLGAAGSGAESRNLISKHVNSTISGSGGAGINVPDVTMTSSDNSTIKTDTAAVSVALVASGSVGVSLAIGISLATNQINNHVETSITNAVVAANSGLSLTSNEGANITASSIAAALSAGVAGTIGVAVSGAGATADNQLSNKTLAFIEGSTITGGSANVQAFSFSQVNAIIVAASAAVGGGSTAGVGAAIGVSLATNTIGTPTDEGGPGVGDRSSQIIAYIDNSSVQVLGSINVESRVTDFVDATVVAGAVAAGLGTVGAAVAGAGASVSNSIQNQIRAYIEDSTGSGITGGYIHVHACNDATINSLVGAATLSGAAGLFSGAVSVSVALSENLINNDIDAYIARSNVTSSDRIDLESGEMARLTSDAFAAAASVSIGIGFALSGGGAESIGDITSTSDARVLDSTVTTGDMEILATHSGTTLVKTSAIAVSIGLVGLAAAGSVATSTVTSNANSLVSGSNVTASGYVGIITDVAPHAKAKAAGLTASTGAAVGVSTATITLDGTVTAKLDSKGKTFSASSLEVYAEASPPMGFYLPFDPDVDPNADPSVAPPSLAFAQGSAGGLLIGTDATVTSATNNIKVYADIAADSVVDVTSFVDVIALNYTEQTAESSSWALGLIAAGVTQATTTSNTEKIARIGDNARITARTLNVKTFGDDQNIAETAAGAAGGISGAVAIPSTNTTSLSKAEIGDGATINVSGLMRVNAQHRTRYDAVLTATSGGVISGGGGDLDNKIDSTVISYIGAGANITAQAMGGEALNQVVKRAPGENGSVDATAGGLVAGVGVDNDTELTLRTTVEVGDGATMNIGRIAGDRMVLNAVSEITAKDEITLRSGGLAAGGINDNTIRTILDDSRVIFGDNIDIKVKGELAAWARGGGKIDIQANSETFGAATIGEGISTIDIRPTKSVIVRPGAKLEATRDIKLSAGTGTDFNEDEYDIKSRVDTFAGSAIPIDLMDATATFIQTNLIDVMAGSSVRSAGDILLHTDRFGDNNVLAQAKAVNWVSGITNGINALTGAGGVEQFAGTANSQSSGVVNVAGLVETGIARNQKLIINSITQTDPSQPNNPNAFVVNESAQSTGDITYDKRIEVAKTSLDIALEEAQRQLIQYSGNPQLKSFYESEVSRLRAELNKQGFLEVPNGSTTGAQEVVRRTALVLSIDPIIAQAGSISIRAERIDGDGTMNSPSDASVEIINNSQAFLRLEGITIPDQTGGTFLNGQLISDVAAQDPFILVDNRADVTSSQITQNGQFRFAWPTINVIGAIDNSSGKVTLKNLPSGAGSITITSRVEAKEQVIQAGNSGSVTINLPGVGSVYELGGQAYPTWTDFDFSYTFNVVGVPLSFQTNDGAGPHELPRGTAQINSTFGTSTPVLNTAITSHLAQPAPADFNLAGARIFLSAAFVNLNGVIQSGKKDYALTITDAMAAEIEQIRNEFGASGQRLLESNTNEDFRVRWDFSAERIVVEEVESTGGYVDITGRISNTQNGAIRVLSGYSKISINNPKDYDIEIKRLDVSRRGEGTLIIKDINGGSAANPVVSTYRRQGDYVYRNTPQFNDRLSPNFQVNHLPQNGLRYGWTIAEENLERTTVKYGSSSWLGIDFVAPDPEDEISRTVEPIGVPRITESGVYFFVDPSNGERYSYSTSTENISSNTRTCCNYNETNWIGTTTYYATTITENGERTLHNHSIEADRPISIEFSGYDEGRIEIQSKGNVYITDEIENPSGTTTIRSDKSVFGESRGVVGGRIIDIATETATGGSIGTPTQLLGTDVNGEIDFDFISTQSATGQNVQLFEGHRVRVAADHTAGGVPGAVYEYVDTTPRTLNLVTTDYTTGRFQKIELNAGITLNTRQGHIGVFETRGDFLLNRVIANGSQSPVADGDVVLRAERGIQPGGGPGFIGVDGNSIDLIADAGDIGSLDGRIAADAGYFNAVKDPTHQLSAHATGDIYLNPFSTLIVDQIIAGGVVDILLIGSAAIVDGNLIDITDERSIAEITSAVWSDLQLTADLGADLKRTERVAAIKETQNQLYDAYWKFRSRQADPSVYDPAFRVTLLDAERDFYTPLFTQQGTEQSLTGAELDQFVATKMTELEDGRTQEYHALHATWGAVGDAYNPDFDYTLTAAEEAEIDASNKVWTTEELLNLRGVHFLNVTDTEFVIEEPNLVGSEIRINAAGGIGRYQNGFSIRLTDDAGNPAVLDLDELAAIAAAEPGDIIYATQEPSEVIASIGGGNTITLEALGGGNAGTWAALGFSVGQSISLETSTRDTTDSGTFYQISALNGAAMTLDTGGRTLQTDAARNITIAPVITNPAQQDQAAYIRVLRREDIDVKSDGPIFATSPRHIFLGSESDLAIGRVQAASDERVQIKVAGSITNASGGNSEVITGQRVVMEASSGSLGTIDQPIRIDTASGGYVIARAAGDVVIDETNASQTAGDLQINQVFARQGAAILTADGSIVDAFPGDETNVRAAEIVLDAGAAIGLPGNRFDVDVIGEGQFSAFADGDIFVAETAGNLGVRHVLSIKGSVDLLADVSILDASDVVNAYARDSVDAEAIEGLPRTDIVGNNITLTATLGTIGIPGNEVDLDLGEGGTLTTSIAVGQTGPFIIETGSLLVLFQVSPNGPNGAADPPPLAGSAETPTTWSTQRSSLRELVVHFNKPLANISPADVILTNLGVNPSDGNSTVVPLTQANLELSPDGAQLTIKLGVGEIVDGVYQLELRPAAAGGLVQMITPDAQNRLYSLRADWNGDGGVDLLDFSSFVYWFLQEDPVSPAYLDLNNDGGVDLLDFSTFVENFLKEVNLGGGASNQLNVGSDPEGELISSVTTLSSPTDVNGDGRVSALDALNIVNYLGEKNPGQYDEWRRDANRDHRVSALDALVVINQIAADRRSQNDPLESESVGSPTQTQSGNSSALIDAAMSSQQDDAYAEVLPVAEILAAEQSLRVSGAGQAQNPSRSSEDLPLADNSESTDPESAVDSAISLLMEELAF